MTKGKKIMGTGIGMAALAAAGAYFLYGKRTAKNRKRVKGWALQMKGDVLDKMEKYKTLNKKAYHDLVDRTATRYGRVKRVSSSELKTLTADLKNAWTHIGKELRKS